MAGEKTAQLTEEGKIDETTVTEKTNSVMESSLEMAASMPLAMNRILTNDVRKRMGDLRASNGTHGAWARYDGGKLSGENGLDSEFHTIQVGVDTVALLTLRVSAWPSPIRTVTWTMFATRPTCRLQPGGLCNLDG